MQLLFDAALYGHSIQVNLLLRRASIAQAAEEFTIPRDEMRRPHLSPASEPRHKWASISGTAEEVSVPLESRQHFHL